MSKGRVRIISPFLVGVRSIPQEYAPLGEWELEASVDNWLREEGDGNYLLEEDTPV